MSRESNQFQDSLRYAYCSEKHFDETDFTVHFVYNTIWSARPQKIQMYWSKIHLDQFQVSFDPLNFTPLIFGCFLLQISWATLNLPKKTD